VIDPALKQGMESYVAEFLKDYVAPAIFRRDTVRAGLGDERFQALQREVLARLEHQVNAGMEHREQVRSLLKTLWARGPAAPAFEALLDAILRAGSERGRKQP